MMNKTYFHSKHSNKSLCKLQRLLGKQDHVKWQNISNTTEKDEISVASFFLSWQLDKSIIKLIKSKVKHPVFIVAVLAD